MEFTDKESARQYAKQIWANLPHNRRQVLQSLGVSYAVSFINQQAADANKKRLFLTVPIRNEIDFLTPLTSLLDCDLLLPVIDRKKMDFYYYRKAGRFFDLVEGPFAILQPNAISPDLITLPERYDLMIVPSLATDDLGYRLGYGGGYFDRYFDTNKSANSCRKVSVLPVELAEIHYPVKMYDIKLDDRLTDSNQKGSFEYGSILKPV